MPGRGSFGALFETITGSTIILRCTLCGYSYPGELRAIYRTELHPDANLPKIYQPQYIFRRLRDFHISEVEVVKYL